MEQILLDHYKLTNCQLIPMAGYISENYKITSDQGVFVLKVYDFSNEAHEEILAETEMINRLQHLNDSEVSRPVLNTSDQIISVHDNKIYRVLSYVDGTFLAETKHSLDLFESLGKFMAKVDLPLLDFKSAGIERRRLDWDLQNLARIKPLIDKITNVSQRKLVKHFFIQWELNVLPKLPSLRQSIIHNDGNDWNILTKGNQVIGIIDFGDSVYTQLINELAITITYAIFGKEDPLQWACQIITGYHNELPLEKEELDLLYYLIAARLITSVCKSAEEKLSQPNSEYITISEQPAWDLLEKWVKINPTFAKNQFYQAVGFKKPMVDPIENTVSRRKKVTGSNLSVSYQNPIYMESAAFQYMFDRYGNTYLDAYNNIPHVGHQHPRVVEAAQKQIGKLNTNTRYLYDSFAEYAELLLSKFPTSLTKVYFVNSGSAASDLAIRLAQNYSNKKAIAVMEHGYHGNTRLGIDISHYKYSGKGGKGQDENIIQAPIPNTYRSNFKGHAEEIGQLYAQDFIETLKSKGQEVAAFISEPIVGCGGQVPLAPGYLKEIYQYIRSQGGVCISDEVQTGFGRLGDHFWGYEMQNVTPDIVVLGKPMANGHPMGAIVTTEVIADAFDNGMEFFSSFGGNPVSCEIGKAVLQVIEEEELQSNAKEVGNYQLTQLQELQKDFPIIGDVRGSGLFTGIELIKDELLTPNRELAQFVKNAFREKQILISTDGPYDSVIKSKPPLCFSKDNVDQVVDTLREILLGWKK